MTVQNLQNDDGKHIINHTNKRNFKMHYFTPTNTENYPLVIQKNCPLSNELYTKIMSMTNDYDIAYNTQWIYLADCVSRGTITPIEAYDCISLGYVPEHLTIRPSLYITKF